MAKSLHDVTADPRRHDSGERISADVVGLPGLARWRKAYAMQLRNTGGDITVVVGAGRAGINKKTVYYPQG